MSRKRKLLVTGASGCIGTALRRRIRICDFQDTDQIDQNEKPGTSRWLSPRDMAELTACCLEVPHPQFGIFYGVSRGAEQKWDISNARKLVGWEPRDGEAEFTEEEIAGFELAPAN